MSVLLDTNILTRLIQRGHPHQAPALATVKQLGGEGERLCIVPQNLYELWAVCTRPEGENGLGMTAAQARTEMHRARSLFEFLPDNGRVFEEWETLVAAHEVKGRNAHDARLVAAMRVHGITRLLTFNASHFTRFAGIEVLDPASFIGA